MAEQTGIERTDATSNPGRAINRETGGEHKAMPAAFRR